MIPAPFQDCTLKVLVFLFSFTFTHSKLYSVSYATLKVNVSEKQWVYSLAARFKSQLHYSTINFVLVEPPYLYLLDKVITFSLLLD